ncbi:MAG: ankyrin repeat domain-containing protein [Planctomycetota bacterium]
MMREDKAYAMDRAIERGDAATLQALLEAEPRLTGTPVPVKRVWGEEMWLGLHRAAERGNAELVALLLDAGASVDARTRFRTPMHGRETPLILASRSGQDAVVSLLIEHHADIDLLDANHRSALSHSAEAGQLPIIHRLLGIACEIDPVDDQGRTPLHWSIQGGHADVALALIEAGADMNHPCPKEPGGFTPLHRCATVGEAMGQVAERLRLAGADTARRDPRFGKTAAELA